MCEEKVIDGILHFELHGEFVPYSQQFLTSMLLASRSREANPLYHYHPPAKVPIDVYPDNGSIYCRNEE